MSDLERMIGDAVRRASYWHGYAVPVELQDGTVVKIAWIGNRDTVRVDGVGEFRITVTAEQLPPPETSRAELADSWELATWADVKGGDTVRVPGSTQEAEVIGVLPLEWKGSGAKEVRVHLNLRDQPYAFPPSGKVEIYRIEVGGLS